MAENPSASRGAAVGIHSNRTEASGSCSIASMIKQACSSSRREEYAALPLQSNDKPPPPSKAGAQPAQGSGPLRASRSAAGRSTRPAQGAEVPATTQARRAAEGSQVAGRPADAGGDAPTDSMAAAAVQPRIAAPAPAPVRPTGAGGAALVSPDPGRESAPAPPSAPAAGGGGGGEVVSSAAAADPGGALAGVIAAGWDEVGDVMLDPVTLEVRPAPDSGCCCCCCCCCGGGAPDGGARIGGGGGGG